MAFFVLSRDTEGELLWVFGVSPFLFLKISGNVCGFLPLLIEIAFVASSLVPLLLVFYRVILEAKLFRGDRVWLDWQGRWLVLGCLVRICWVDGGAWWWLV